MAITVVNASIQEVTVYVDRARVTRRGTAHISQGEHTLTFPNLPVTLQDDSVRASGKGANVRILNVEVATEFASDQPEGRVAEWRLQLEALRDDDKSLADSDEIVVRKLDFLKGLQDASGLNLARAAAYGKATTENIDTLLEYLTKDLQSIYAERREIARKRRDLAEQIAALQDMLSRVQQPATHATRAVYVTVEATADEADVELEIMYGVYNASWEPLYDIRLVDTRVEMTYLANVRQQSGEDWPPVQLSLSTARPSVSSGIPELDPWYIDVYRPTPPAVYKRAAAPMQMMAMSESPGDAAVGGAVAEPVPPPMQSAEAELESSGAAVTYRVVRPVSIPSDGAPHKTTITTMDLDAQLDYVTVPRLAEEAYLRAKITNSSPFIFLAGSANIFHGADFVGATRLEMVVPKAELEVQLGVDDRIKVERELTGRQIGKTFIGNTRRTAFGYKITVTSHLDSPAQVTLFDQLPVSRNEEIKVKLQEASPTPTEQSDLNIMKWKLQLAPQQKQEVVFEFVVEQPRSVQVTGITE
ncbi:MAG: mucoidy inhibitor MuiA family protein [Chloroflexota bacterium]|nr:mucoidy inhibitor MuiA family protein [Chloroflexota bacterium]